MYLSYRAATLDECQPSTQQEDLTALNALSPTRLDWDDVFVRSMYLCSDRPCECDWSRFTPHALEQIARLVIGQSVITGHDRRSLPLARFFKAKTVERTGPDGEPVRWVQAWFYWLRETSGAVDLLLNIDGGIYREVSIAWRYRHWTCSICGEEDGLCAHRPGEVSGEQRCLRVIDEIVDVLEGSLVYKGADQGATLARSFEGQIHGEDEPLLCIWADENPLFRSLLQHELLADVREFDPDALGALENSVSHVWIDDFQETVWAGHDMIKLLQGDGDLLTREADGSVEKYLSQTLKLTVQREDTDSDEVYLTARHAD